MRKTTYGPKLDNGVTGAIPMYRRFNWVVLGLLFLLPVASAQAIDAPAEAIPGDLDWVVAMVREAAALGDESLPQIPQLPGGDEADEGDAARVPPADDDSFADRLRTAFGNRIAMASLAGVLLSGLGLAGFALVTRYISPKEALKNPQRAMLYGFVRATPGVHLKKLSEEFGMKTSSILWHMRKLEAAELVQSEHANGYRVFCAVEGGVEMKRVSRAVTAIHNENARHIFQFISRDPGISTKSLANRLTLNPGNVRWHLRKLRDCGLVEELVRETDRLLYPTPLGVKALEAAEGRPVDGPAVVASTPTPVASD